MIKTRKTIQFIIPSLTSCMRNLIKHLHILQIWARCTVHQSRSHCTQINLYPNFEPESGHTQVKPYPSQLTSLRYIRAKMMLGYTVKFQRNYCVPAPVECGLRLINYSSMKYSFEVHKIYPKISILMNLYCLKMCCQAEAMPEMMTS